MKKRNLLFAVLLLNILSSCVIGTKMSFSKAELNTPIVAGNVPLTVVTKDSRPYVLTGDKTPEWVGLQRSGNGIPYGVHTHSGKTLANEFSESIVNSFKKRGASASLIVLPKDIKTKDQAEDYIKRNVLNGKVLFLEIAEWKSDTLVDVNFTYDLTLSVLESSLITLGSKSVKSYKALSGSFVNPVSASEKAVTAEQGVLLNELLNSPEIVRALGAPTSVPTSAVVPAVSRKVKEAQPVQAPAAAPKVEVKKEVPTTNSSSPELDSAKERMDKLKKARDQGVLTEEEYQQKRKAVVDAL